MKPLDILNAVLQFGPTVLPLIGQLTTWIKENKQTVSAEDIAQLIAYGKKTSNDYLKEAGITPTAPPQ